MFRKITLGFHYVCSPTFTYIGQLGENYNEIDQCKIQDNMLKKGTVYYTKVNYKMMNDFK